MGTSDAQARLALLNAFISGKTRTTPRYRDYTSTIPLASMNTKGTLCLLLLQLRHDNRKNHQSQRAVQAGTHNSTSAGSHYTYRRVGKDCQARVCTRVSGCRVSTGNAKKYNSPSEASGWWIEDFQRTHRGANTMYICFIYKKMTQISQPKSEDTGSSPVQHKTGCSSYQRYRN